ncbi:MAG: hypothetical protein A2Y73_04920 [Chloroflexi bacterium RBG_13_56_8]|nr:MAG: hypothetical protein A2Y73_04920 [Chloroflexi bacterium RBG_13_56_8]
MVVHTDSSKAVDARRFVLQLFFAERNHFCMFCQMSGSCELQDLAYQHGLDHWEYDRIFPKLPVDASRIYFSLDHNRCILCRRCVRVCDELVGNKTIGVKNRGTASMIIADTDVPFGDSSCISCGTCLQVCPTGALIDRASAYMGATDEISRVKTTCTLCSIGCGAELIVRDNHVIRVEGDWDAEPNHGLLCEIGRFSLLHEQRQRVRVPLVRDGNSWREVSWEEALGQVAKRLQAAGNKLGVVVSGLASSEAAKAAVGSLPGEKMLLEGTPSPNGQFQLSALDEADLYLVVNTDLTVGSNYQVAGFAIKRGVRHRGARLILLGEGENGLDDWALYKWGPKDAEKAVELAAKAQQPAIVFSSRGAELARGLAKKLPKATLLGFAPGANTLGLVAQGVNKPFSVDGKSTYYVLAAELAQPKDALLSALRKADYVVVQASYREPWDNVADVILPSPTSHEKQGTVTNTEGRIGKVVAGVTTKLPGEAEVIKRIGALL